MYRSPNRPWSLAVALMALSVPALTACGGGHSAEGATSPGAEGPSISMKSALGSQAAATKACKSLLGDGTGLAKAAMWPTVPAKQLTVSGQISGDVDGVVVCGVNRSGSEDGLYVHVANTVNAENTQASHAEENDSSTTSHVTATNQEANTGAVIAEIPTQSVGGLTTYLDGLVKRVKQ